MQFKFNLSRLSVQNLKSPLSLTVSVSLQRLDNRLSLLQSAVDEYIKAKNDFAAKVNLWGYH